MKFRIEGPPAAQAMAHLDENRIVLEFAVIELDDEGTYVELEKAPAVGHCFAPVRRDPTDAGWVAA